MASVPSQVEHCPIAVPDQRTPCSGSGGPVRAALAEAEVFPDRLLRVPGLRLARSPDIGWNPLVTGYELRGCELVIEEERSC